MKSQRDAAASPSQGQAIHSTSSDLDDASPAAVAPSRHSRFLARPSEPCAPRSPLAPPQPLPVRARVGTQPPGSRLIERAAAVVARVKTGRHRAASITTPLSASLSAPPAVSPATAAATSQVLAPSAALSPAVTPASPLPPSALPPPSSPLPPSPPVPPAPSSPPRSAPPPVAPFSVAVPAFASSATTLAVSLAVVENPAGERFAVRASLHWSGPSGASGQGGHPAIDERAVEIGRIIPEPPSPDEPGGEPSGLIGTFLLPLSAPARALLCRRDGQTRLRLIIRAAGEAPLSPALHVKILPPRWH